MTPTRRQFLKGVISSVVVITAPGLLLSNNSSNHYWFAVGARITGQDNVESNSLAKEHAKRRLTRIFRNVMVQFKPEDVMWRLPPTLTFDQHFNADYDTVKLTARFSVYPEDTSNVRQ